MSLCGGFMNSDRLGSPSNATILAEYGKKEPQEVYEFEAVPEIDCGTVSWSAPMIKHGARYALESAMCSVRVVIPKDVPRDGVITALKDILDLLETYDSLRKHAPHAFA